MEPDILFQPLEFRNLTVKNRIFRARETLRHELADLLSTEE